MKTKTWKIGEYCKGGIITVEIHGKLITVIGKEWDYSTGSHRGSDQSKAKEFTRGTVMSDEPDAFHKLYEFLSDLTTHYYSTTIIDWIKTKTNINTMWF